MASIVNHKQAETVPATAVPVPTPARARCQVEPHRIQSLAYTIPFPVRLLATVRRSMTYLEPFFPALLLLSLAGFVWYVRRRSRGSVIALAMGLFGLALFSWPPVAWLAMGTLEWWYPVQPIPTGKVDAIVVLSGYVVEPEPDRPYAIAGRNTYWRCYHAAWLYKQWCQVPVIATGVNAADTMGEILRKEGVPDDAIWLERNATRTYEHALYIAEMLRHKDIRRVALVTDAHHMLRAEACFKKQGVPVIPAPCVFRTTPVELKLDFFLPGSAAIRQNEETLHEWIGILWYKLKGWL